MRTLILSLAIVAAPAKAAEQMDLVCEGQWRFSVRDPWEAITLRLRLDLSAKRYCEQDCVVTKPIAEVQPNLIVLAEASEEEKASGTISIREIDRTSGSYTRFLSARRPEHKWIEHKATCRPAPFSGFPALPRKF